MDPAVQRLLNDKLYDKRKQGALESVTAQFHCDWHTADELPVSKGLFGKQAQTRNMRGLARSFTSSAMTMRMQCISRTPGMGG